MNRRRFIGLSAASPIAARVLLAQGQGYAKTRAFLANFIAEGQANGAIGCVYRRDTLELEAVEGWLDAGQKNKMRADAVFYLASLSKPVAGVAGMKLVEMGKIKLEDPVERWLPELANRKVLRKPDGPLDDTYPAPRPITVQDLLSMHMGMGGDGPAGPFADALKKNEWSAYGDPDTWLKGLSAIPLQYAPGERWLNDTSVDVLGVLIRRVTGGTLTAFQREHIFEPLGMRDTAYYVPAEKMERLAGYPEPNKPTATRPATFESGGDGLYGTAPDYLRFARMLLNKGELDGKRILRVSSIDAMAVDRFRPAEHRNGGFYDRYPGRGFGFTVAVRTEAMAVGPSVGAYGWSGSSGPWFVVDPARDMLALLMTQHPTKGRNAKTGAKYLSKIEENDQYQAAVYSDLAGQAQ